MKDISIYFQPVEKSKETEGKLSASIIRYSEEGNFPEIEKNGVALFFVPEYRGWKQDMIASQHEFFRLYLDELSLGADWKMPLYDLGNILPGNAWEDTLFAVSQVVSELVKMNVIPVVIGGSQDLTVALYKGYEQLEQMVNLCAVDYQLDLGNPDTELDASGYLSHLLLQRPCYLFNHANIGLQIPFASQSELSLFENLFFDYCRLGEFNADFKKAEPHLRNSDILSMDLCSLRASEVRSDQYSYPNGFYADQLCQIARYAGISDKLTSFGVFNYFPDSKPDSLSALVAQLIWYFLDGVSQRKGDFPAGTKKDYVRFIVHLDDLNEEIIFYKSNKSDRWWMEVPYPPQKGVKYMRHHLVPCDFNDYERAMKNEIPDLWWKTYQKLG